jgi:hypothetical protein
VTWHSRCLTSRHAARSAVIRDVPHSDASRSPGADSVQDVADAAVAAALGELPAGAPHTLEPWRMHQFPRHVLDRS